MRAADLAILVLGLSAIACNATPASEQGQDDSEARKAVATEQEETKEGDPSKTGESEPSQTGDSPAKVTLTDTDGKTHPLQTVLMQQQADGTVKLLLTNRALTCDQWLQRDAVRIVPADEVEAKASIKQTDDGWVVDYLYHGGTSSQGEPLGTVIFVGELDPTKDVQMSIDAKIERGDNALALEGKATAKGCGTAEE